MRSMMKWMLGVALAAGIVGMSATPAQAARVHVGVYVGAPGYVAPYPGPGYVWVGGYWANGYWVPGYWNYVGIGPGFRGGIVIDRGRDHDWDYGRDYRRDYDRDHYRHGRDYDRHYDRRW